MEINFSYDAPASHWYDADAAIRQINSKYKGAETVWVYVDVDTGKNPQFVSEGDLPDPTTTWRQRSVLLNANNPNHILLMDLLTWSKGHTLVYTDDDCITENVTTAGDIEGAPDFVFQYTDLAEPPAIRYYRVAETHIDESGVVTYEWDTEEKVNRQAVYNSAFGLRNQTENMMKDPVVISVPAALAQCQRHIAVLNYAMENLLHEESTIPAYKVILPLVHEV